MGSPLVLENVPRLAALRHLAGHPLKHLEQLPAHRHHAGLLGLGVLGFKKNHAVFKVHPVPGQPQDFTAPHAGI
jgi:hypothetical protein